MDRLVSRAQRDEPRDTLGARLWADISVAPARETVFELRDRWSRHRTFTATSSLS